MLLGCWAAGQPRLKKQGQDLGQGQFSLFFTRVRGGEATSPRSRSGPFVSRSLPFPPSFLLTQQSTQPGTRTDRFICTCHHTRLDSPQPTKLMTAKLKATPDCSVLQQRLACVQFSCRKKRTWTMKLRRDGLESLSCKHKEPEAAQTLRTFSFRGKRTGPLPGFTCRPFMECERSAGWCILQTHRKLPTLCHVYRTDMPNMHQAVPGDESLNN